MQNSTIKGDQSGGGVNNEVSPMKATSLCWYCCYFLHKVSKTLLLGSTMSFGIIHLDVMSDSMPQEVYYSFVSF